MTSYSITPRDPMIVRDGRPNDGQSESDTLPFPYPGTLAGLMRTAVGSDPKLGFTMSDRLEELRAVSIRGPLLATEARTLLVPAPADAVFAEADNEGWRVSPARPMGTPSANGVEVDGGLDAELELVGLDPAQPTLGKPPKGLPAFWPWSAFERWLNEPNPMADLRSALADGVGGLLRDTRTHVRIGEDGTAEDGMLFTTTGLSARVPSVGSPKKFQTLSLWVHAEVPKTLGRSLSPGARPFGGERRIVFLEPSTVALPGPPKALIQHLSSESAVLVRAILLTPALFPAGYRPGPQSPLLGGCEARLVGCAVGRPQTVSGWDLAKRGPKPTRRLAPAGSVYWIELSGPAAEKRAWLERLWMQNASDAEQDRRDGYGLVAIGLGHRWVAGGVR